ncbi:hypothetical protein SUGI_0665550 [Cryptomeria japonica]|nr:hypothetical protein SUGI_0665550 [Cryptomeria japonica]
MQQKIAHPLGQWQPEHLSFEKGSRLEGQGLPVHSRQNKLGGKLKTDARQDIGDWRIQKLSNLSLPKDVAEMVEVEKKVLKELGLIGKVIGCNPSRGKLRAWITKSWNFISKVTFLPKSFFMVEFEHGQKRDEVLDQTVWWMDRNLVYAEMWSSNFNPRDMMPSQNEFGIHLCNLPLEHWTPDCLRKIGFEMGIVLGLVIGEVVSNSEASPNKAASGNASNQQSRSAIDAPQGNLGGNVEDVEGQRKCKLIASQGQEGVASEKVA